MFVFVNHASLSSFGVISSRSCVVLRCFALFAVAPVCHRLCCVTPAGVHPNLSCAPNNRFGLSLASAPKNWDFFVCYHRQSGNDNNVTQIHKQVQVVMEDSQGQKRGEQFVTPAKVSKLLHYLIHSCDSRVIRGQWIIFQRSNLEISAQKDDMNGCFVVAKQQRMHQSYVPELIALYGVCEGDAAAQRRISAQGHAHNSVIMCTLHMVLMKNR